MLFQCPCCNSKDIAFLRTAMTVGTIVGPVGGTALAGSQIGATVGGVGSCAIGAQLREKLDRYVLANYLCLACGHRFNLPT